jgi:hypothetical protein
MRIDDMGEADLRLYARSLEAERDGAEKRAREASDLARSHFVARTRAEAALTDARRGGIVAAARWLRDLPRVEVVIERVKIGERLVREVALALALRLEERLVASEEVTRPSLADLDEDVD